MSEQEKQALISALRLLAATPKSRKGLTQKLERKGYSQEVLQNILNRLEKQGLLNDQVYAQSLYRSFLTLRPSGRKRIAFELEKKGIGSALIRSLLDEYSPETERENAWQVAEEKYNRWIKLDAKKRRKKIYDFLVRRGFDFVLAREVVEKLDRKMACDF